MPAQARHAGDDGGRHRGGGGSSPRGGRHLHVIRGAAAQAAEPQWLAACFGFLVDCEDGTPFGVVDDVVFAPDGRAAALLVVTGAFGGRITSVTPDEIVEIRPVERRVIVARRPDASSRRHWWSRSH